MNEHEDQALSQLYQSSRGDEGPSELLDRRIRNAARRQLKQKGRRWVWGLSTAAVLVLSLSVVLQVQEQQDEAEILRLPVEKTEQPAAPAPAARPAPERTVQPMSDAGIELEQRREMNRKRSGMIKQRLETEQRRQISSESDQESLSLFSQAEEVRAAAPASLSVFPSPPQIPQLPTSPIKLVAIAPGLEIASLRDDGITELLFLDDRILRLAKEPGGTAFQAWPGSEVLGVKVDWGVSRHKLQDCREEDMLMVCSWGDQVEALFDAGRLDHIRWRQNP